VSHLSKTLNSFTLASFEAFKRRMIGRDIIAMSYIIFHVIINIKWVMLLYIRCV